MTRNEKRAAITHLLFVICWFAGGLAAWQRAWAEPLAVPTFHSIGLYWSPQGGGPDRSVRVRYREADTDLWFDGLAMRYNPITGTDMDLADYRGSLVHLRPGSTYEIQLSLDDGTEDATVIASTWPEDFPLAKTIQVSSSNEPLDITESGSPEGYVLYDGSGATIDVQDQSDYDVTIDASYVIIRGLVLKGAHRDGVRILGGHDIILEDLDISGWGRLDFDGDYGQNMDAALFCSNEEVTRVVMQRCLMHDPRYGSNSWADYNCHSENSCSNHPAGPQVIVFINSAGNHVFRYNEAWSTTGHYYNDIFGGGSNGSFEGFPGPDSDIYGNDLANCWDDGIEAEGGGRNVRIWANHVTDTFLAYANAPTSIGPMYWWRNVSGRCYTPDDSQYGSYGPFMKMGYADSVEWMTGHMYLFHNTIWNADDQGCGGIGGSSRWIKHCVTRNNVLHVRSDAGRSISIRDGNQDNDFDSDLYSAEVPADSEAQGISAVPTYAATGYDPLHSAGDYQLAQGSAGQDDAELLPNFDDYFLGDAPDMGVQETGTAPMVFGVSAGQPPRITTEALPDTAVGRNYEFHLDAAGGRGPILWTLIAGSLAPGLSLDRDGTIHGIPQQAGSYSFSLYARNADFLLDRADLTMTVLEQGECIPPEVLCGSDCIDITSDPEHCGSCDRTCDPGQVCLDSICRPEGDTTDGGTGDGGPGEADATNHSSKASQGCGCMLGTRDDGGSGAVLFIVLALVVLSRQRRR